MRRPALPLLLALILTPCARADEQLVRTKANPVIHFSGQIPVTLTIRPAFSEARGGKGADNKQSGQTQERPAITRKQIVSYRVKIQGFAFLRKGESESFRVTAEHTHPQEHVRLRLVTDRTVWDYQGAGEVLIPIQLSMAAARSPVQGTFTLVPTKRHAITPPNLIGTVHLETGGPTDPIHLEFDDPGVLDDGGAKTSYAVEIKRSRTMWFAKSIVKGEVPARPGVRQRLTLTKDGPLHAARDEWLLKDSKYTVTIRVRKTSSDYTIDGSPPSTMEFKFIPRERAPESGAHQER
jgi:hypothetical protein